MHGVAGSALTVPAALFLAILPAGFLTLAAAFLAVLATAFLTVLAACLTVLVAAFLAIVVCHCVSLLGHRPIVGGGKMRSRESTMRDHERIHPE